jgi:hypothetical protein
VVAPASPPAAAAATLDLSLGAAASFAPFIPGVGKDYTATMSATLTSTAGDATLSVADASPTATGRMTNGAFALTAPVQVSAAPSAGIKVPATAEPMGPLGGSAAPTRLLTYGGPLGGEVATLNFKQSIGGAEALRTGGYSKTLTFTLSTATP